MITALRGIDSCGIVVDRAAFADDGADLIGQLEQQLGDQGGATSAGASFDSPDGRFHFLEMTK